MTATLASVPLMPHFGAAHFGALAVSAALGVALISVARSGRWPKALGRFELTLSMLLLTSYPAMIVARFIDGVPVTVDVMYPMHLCDVAAITAFFALVFRHPLAAELTYFWGLAGTLQALLTPSTCYDFPSLPYFVYFQLHAGVVIAAVYLPLGLGWRPRPGAVLRAWVWGIGYVALAGLVDWLAGANYAFLREPAEGSLMEVLGSWPWYIASMIGLALVLFTFLWLPFWRPRRRRER